MPLDSLAPDGILQVLPERIGAQDADRQFRGRSGKRLRGPFYESGEGVQKCSLNLVLIEHLPAAHHRGEKDDQGAPGWV